MGNPVVHFEMGAVDDHMETGAFRDPAGNVFGVYHHGAH
jgi:hypothetical protein